MSPVKESTLGQAKSKTTKAVLAQGQSSEQVGQVATLDPATTEETVGGATMDQHASPVATKTIPKQTTSEEAVGETEPIPTPPASDEVKQSTGTSPVQGATAQQALDQLTECLSTLELSSGIQVKPTTPGQR